MVWRHLADVDLLSCLWVNELGHLLLHHLLLLHLHLVLVHLFWSHFLHVWVHLVHHVWVHAFLHLHLLLLLMHLELFFIHLSFIWIHAHSVFHLARSRFLHLLHSCHLILFIHLLTIIHLVFSRSGFHWRQLFSLLFLHLSFSWLIKLLLFFSVHFVSNSKSNQIYKIITYNYHLHTYIIFLSL